MSNVAVPPETLRQLERLTLVPRRPARAGAGGEHVSRRPAPSTDFIDYRPYQPGDDFRRVDWNVYARLGSLQVKVTEGRERLDVLLILDCSSSMTEKLAFGGQLVTALAHVAAARSDSVRVVCLGQTVSGRWPLRRRAQVPDLIRSLSTVVPAGLVDLNRAFADCAASVQGSTLVIVISDLLTPRGVVEGLEALGARVPDIALIHLVHADELEPPLSGEVELLDAESGATLQLGVSLATLSAYRARFAAWLQAREAECLRRGIRYARVRTDTPLATAVMRDLRHAGLLR